MLRIAAVIASLFCSTISLAQATYSCGGQCQLDYIDRYTGATDSMFMEIGPVSVTIFSPDASAVDAAQVQLAPMCGSACAYALPAGTSQMGCALSAAGPCSRID